MTEVKYTPGPWSVSAHEGYPNHIEAKDPFERGHLNLVRIAEAFQIQKGDSQHEYNMHLIAAAPDLLEALKDARFALYGNGPGNPKIDAAISKAEGRA